MSFVLSTDPPNDTGSRPRAALYLRMSTELQTYSLDNQRDALLAYANAHRIQIVRTYEDAARSGLRVTTRPGLRALIADVLSGAGFELILVYDVSRWGRFQDSDEAAYYEFLCRANGVQIRYCAEGFQGQEGAPAALMKAMKRIMAAEYSRELSAKVLAGHERLFRLGYRQGASAVLGTRRLLVDAEGRPKAYLGRGERKSLQSDRVFTREGLQADQDLVRNIFAMRGDEGLSASAIARRLNAGGVRNARGRPWRRQAITDLLRNEIYVGVATFNKSSQRLGGPRRINRPSCRLRREGVIAPVVAVELFERTQALLAAAPRPRSECDIIQSLSRLLEKEGRLSAALIDADPHSPSSSTILRRFGSLANAYAQLNYLPVVRRPADRSAAVESPK